MASLDHGLLKYFLQRLDYSKLYADHCPYSHEGEEHALVERKCTFFGDGFFEGMYDSLVVLLRLGNEFDLDVFKGEHGEDLGPP